MIVRSSILPEDYVEVTTASRTGLVTTMTVRRASFGDPEYGELLDMIQAADYQGYVDFEPTKVIPETAPAGFVIDLSDWPEGTKMKLTNESGDELIHEDKLEPVTLVDPGKYKIQIVPPLPYHSYLFDLVLEDG